MRHPGMNSFEQMMSRARRRELIHRGLRLSGWGLAGGVALGLVLVLVDRLTAATAPVFLYPLLASLGAMAGLIVAMLSLPPRLSTAVTLDRMLRLKDRIGSVESLDDAAQAGSAARDPEFMELLRSDAQRLAQRIDIRAATPIHFTGIWGVAILQVVALLLILQFMPEVEWARPGPSRVHAARQTEQAQAQAREIALAIEQSVARLPDDPALDERAREELAALERLAEQLARREATPDDVNRARDESAARLNDLADRLAEQARRDLAASEDLARRFSGLDAADRPEPPMSAAEFDEALRRGDFGAAARELQELLRDADNLPPAERKAAADHLRDLAQQIQPADEHPEDAEHPDDHLVDALREMGMNEEAIERLMREPPSPQEIEQALRDMGLDEDTAQQVADDFREQAQEQQQREQVDRDAQEVAETLKDAADKVETPPPPPATTSPAATQPQPPQTQPGAQARDQQADPTDQQQQPLNDQPQAQEQSQDQSGREPTSQPRQQPSSQSDQQDQAGGEPQASEQPGAQPQQQPGGESQQPQPGAQPESQQQPGTQPAREQAPSSQEQEGPSQPADQQQASSQPDSARPQRVPEAGQPQPNAQEREGTEQAPSDQQEAQDRIERQPGAVPRDQPNPGSERSSSPDDSSNQEQASEQDGSAESPQPPPADAIRRMADRMRSAEERQQASEQMREAARRIAENMSPQERERWAEMWRRQMGEPPADGMGPGAGRDPGSEPRLGDGDPSRSGAAARQDLDLRGEEVADQVIAQWLVDDPLAAPDGALPRAPAERVRQAQSVAERAVNQSTVHRRYHKAIKRYFGNLDQTIEGAKEEP